MEKIFEQGLLYDFYGELLTKHQRNIYEDAVYNDMSLGEIAEENGISRQGVHDLIKRCDKILADYESKLHLVERFARVKEKLDSIEDLTLEESNVQFPVSKSENTESTEVAQRMIRIRELTHEIMEEL